MNDFTGRVRRDEWKPPAGFQRTVTLALDAAQYQIDMESMAETKSEDIYSTFNLLMRRKPKACIMFIRPCHVLSVPRASGSSSFTLNLGADTFKPPATFVGGWI